MKKLSLILAGVALLATAAIAQVSKRANGKTEAKRSSSTEAKIVSSDGHVNLDNASPRKKHMAKKAIKHVGVKPVSNESVPEKK